MGASAKADKYAHRAFTLLRQKGYRVAPVHPKLDEIEGVKVYKSIEDISEPIDTVTMYVAAETSSKLASSILKMKPKRIIFNPGAENPELEKSAKQQGIHTLNACTLVMLTTNQFGDPVG